MDPKIRARLSDEVLSAAAGQYGITAADLRTVGGFESFIYAFTRDGQDYILRLGHDSRRPVDLVSGELDFINALAEGGTGVAAAVATNSGAWAANIPDGQGENFVATAFVFAPGHRPTDADWNPTTYESYGRLIGRMHAISRTYEPGRPEWRRPEWDDVTMDRTLVGLANEPPVIAERYRELLAAANALPRTADNYGLIHFDAHIGNCFIDDNGRFTLFDFDDCAYNWYVCDIAMVVFYKAGTAADPVGHTHEFLPHFLRGYRQEQPLAATELATIPLFLKMREIDLYAAVVHDVGKDNLQGWLKIYMDGREARIENSVPFLDVDFVELGSNPQSF